MAPTDIRITDVRLDFAAREFDNAFSLSGATMTVLTEARAEVDVTTSRGVGATGSARVFLATGWAYPGTTLDQDRKDAVMRAISSRFAEHLRGHTDPADPLRHAHELGAMTFHVLDGVRREAGLDHEVPQLVASVCMAPLDGAVWDAWGRAAGGSALDLVGEAHLTGDLSAYLGPAFRRHYPSDMLVPARRRLPVQHVLAVTDPIDEQHADPQEPPRSLRDWTARDGLHRLKMKITGTDPAADARRIQHAHALMVEAGDRAPDEIRISLDPNEACRDTAPMIELLDRLAKDRPETRSVIDYIEQPTPRDADGRDTGIARLAALVPVVADEGIAQLSDLQATADGGWSGVAVKTGKGFSSALLGYCWARLLERAVVIQDLTNPGIGLVQSAALASRLLTTSDAFECNSRQYVPSANVEAAERWPGLFRASDGHLDTSDLEDLGLT